MSTLAKQLFEPTGVEVCVSGRFTPASAGPADGPLALDGGEGGGEEQEQEQLIVAKTTVLDVYRVNRNEETGTAKLVLVAHFVLQGRIVSMCVVRLQGQPLDSLLLSFEEAKVSVVQYDPARRDLKTVAMFQLEDEKYKGGRADFALEPKLWTDPGNKCAALMLYDRHLAIFPFRQGILATTDGSGGSTSTSNAATTKAADSAKPIILSLTQQFPKIANVRDVCFLHGYNEPTIAVLCEPVPTNMGRIVVRRDTYSIFIISLDLAKENHTIIWSQEGLATDSLRLQPVPRPIGGVLIIATTSICHVNQGSGVFALALNPFAAKLSTVVSQAPKRLDRSDVAISLSSSTSVFLTNDRLLLSLQSGDLFSIQFKSDGRQVYTVLIEKSGSSVHSSALCTLGKDLLFLGSRLNDSTLIKFEEIKHESKSSAKKPRVDSIMAANLDELDLLLLSADQHDDHKPEIGGSKIWPQFKFSVCDSLINIGPIADLAIGQPASAYFADEDDAEIADDPAQQQQQTRTGKAPSEKAKKKSFEVVTCSGHGRNSALCVLQNHVRPEVLTDSSIPQSNDIWAVCCPNPNQVLDDEPADDIGQRDNFLVISCETQTIVLKCDNDLLALQSSGFYTTGPTIYCGAICDNTLIVQVYRDGVYLLDHKAALVQLYALESGKPVVSCAQAGSHLVLQYIDGLVDLLRVDKDKQRVLPVALPQHIKANAVHASTVFEDVNRLLLTKEQYQRQHKHAQRTTRVASKFDLIASLSTIAPDIDETDLELYGESILDKVAVGSGDAAGSGTKRKHDEDEEIESHPSLAAAEPQSPGTVLLVLYFKSGTLEFFDVSTLESVFAVPHFGFFPTLLTDDSAASVVLAADKAHDAEEQGHRIAEIALVTLGSAGAGHSVYLMARTDIDNHALFEGFTYSAEQGDGHQDRLALRFTRTPTNFFTPESFVPKAKVPDAMDVVEDEETKSIALHKRKFRTFAQIGSTSGVFMTGPRPLFMFAGRKGGLYCHPLVSDSTAVKAFSSFNNVNCPNGFAYFEKTDVLKIAMLPTTVNYDLTSWLIRKVPIRRTPIKISYNPDARCYAVATTTPFVFTTPIPKRASDSSSNQEDLYGEPPAEPEAQADAEKHNERPARDPTSGVAQSATTPNLELHQLELVVPTSLETIDSFAFKDYEHVLALRVCSLNSQQTTSGRKNYICVGTIISTTEEQQTKGRVLIFEVIDVVPDPERPSANRQLRKHYDKLEDRPVTALSEVNGNLITCIGQRIYVQSFKDGETLEVIAFIDQQIFATSISTIRNYVMIGDAFKSIWFMRFRDGQSTTLDLIGKDYDDMEVFSCDFIVDGKNLLLVVTDTDMNVHMYTFAPQVAESLGGHKLLHQADYHVGHTVSRFLRVPARNQELHQRHFGLMGTLDGSLDALLPLSEKSFRRLQYLQRKLNTFVPHHAGLNPRAFRAIQWSQPRPYLPKRNVLDGNLLWRYAILSLNDQRDLAMQIGSSVDQIMQDLLSFQDATMIF